MVGETLSEMIKNRKGYRTETCSGSCVRDLEEILRFEIGELGNTDVLEYLKENHNILLDFELDENTINDLKEAAVVLK